MYLSTKNGVFTLINSCTLQIRDESNLSQNESDDTKILKKKEF